jgi:outer membrane biogenesis lipoprotein LolB
MSKILFVVFAAIALVACNKAESLEPKLQGAWNNAASIGWNQIRFSNGVIIASQNQKSPLQGKYTLQDKTLKLELFASVGGRQVKQADQNATVEKLDGNTLELKMNGQTTSFTKDIP